MDISERPAVMEDKSRLGDFEIGTIIAAGHKGTAKLVGDALISLLEPVKDIVHTLTADNGKEFARHQRVAADLDAQVYFARPYHSRKRGTTSTITDLSDSTSPRAGACWTSTRQRCVAWRT